MSKEGIQRAKAVSYKVKKDGGTKREQDRSGKLGRLEGQTKALRTVKKTEHTHIDSCGVKRAVSVSRPLVQR